MQFWFTLCSDVCLSCSAQLSVSVYYQWMDELTTHMTWETHSKTIQRWQGEREEAQDGRTSGLSQEWVITSWWVGTKASCSTAVHICTVKHFTTAYLCFVFLLIFLIILYIFFCHQRGFIYKLLVLCVYLSIHDPNFPKSFSTMLPYKKYGFCLFSFKVLHLDGVYVPPFPQAAHSLTSALWSPKRRRPRQQVDPPEWNTSEVTPVLCTICFAPPCLLPCHWLSTERSFGMLMSHTLMTPQDRAVFTDGELVQAGHCFNIKGKSLPLKLFWCCIISLYSILCTHCSWSAAICHSRPFPLHHFTASREHGSAFQVSI